MTRESMHMKYWLTLAKSVVMWTDRPDMTIAVNWEVKHQTHTHKKIHTKKISQDNKTEVKLLFYHQQIVLSLSNCLIIIKLSYHCQKVIWLSNCIFSARTMKLFEGKIPGSQPIEWSNMGLLVKVGLYWNIFSEVRLNNAANIKADHNFRTKK